MQISFWWVGGGGGGGQGQGQGQGQGLGLGGVFLLGMRHWPLRAPTPLQSTLWPIIDPTLVTQFGHANVIFAIPTQPLSIYVSPYQSFKWVSLLTVNMKPSYSKNPKMCEPILVTLWKMQPHYSQSSRENATPSSVAYQPLTRKYPPPHRDFFELSEFLFGQM